MPSQNLITYSERNSGSVNGNSCILRNHSAGYCAHPFVSNNTLNCNYGLTEIKVPRECPLRKKSLTTKLSSQKIEEIEDNQKW